MANEQTKTLISASLRTLAQLVPIAGGAAAQAWSEFEGIQRDARIEEFFAQINARLRAIDNDAAVIKERIDRMPDFSRLLEDAVDMVRRETDNHKRQVYPTFFLNLILQSPSIPMDARSYLLETLDSLTEHDLNVLRQFKTAGWSRGDILTNTPEGEWAPTNVQNPFNAKYEKLLAPFMISTAKLEARGIIVRVPNRHEFKHSGTGGEWYDIYREQTWKLMPVGSDLLAILS